MRAVHRAALIFLFACGASQKPIAARESTCASIAQREVEIIGFVGPRTRELPDQIKQLCVRDQWPDELARCLQPAKTFDDLSACHDHLTPAQRAAYGELMQGSNEPPPEPPPEPLPELHNRQ